MSGFKYSAFGLTIWSEIEFCHLQASVAPADVCIRLGNVPHELPSPFEEGVLYQNSPRRFLLHIHDVAHYLVANGYEITIDPAPGAEINAIGLFLFGSAFGALLHQRGSLPLHGSAVVTPRGAAIFAGFSGSGKSALACAFQQRGYPVLTDEVCAVRTGAAAADVLPGLPYLMLWADTLAHMGLDWAGLEPVRSKVAKYILPLKEGFAHEATPAHAIYILNASNSAPSVPVPIKGLRKIEVLAQNLYRPRFVEQMSMEGVQFQQIMELARQVQVTTVCRPSTSFDVRNIVDLIERDFRA